MNRYQLLAFRNSHRTIPKQQSRSEQRQMLRPFRAYLRIAKDAGTSEKLRILFRDYAPNVDVILCRMKGKNLERNRSQTMLR